jgi:predicted Rossmann fold nucleotide-binding protein DprA/Smf involved in DNA uptake
MSMIHPLGEAAAGRLHETALWLTILDSSRLSRRAAKELLERWCVREQRRLTELGDTPAAALVEGLALPLEQVRLAQQVLGDWTSARMALDRLAQSGIEVIIRTDAAYPEELAHHLPEADLPYLLFAVGELDHLAETGIVIGGSHGAEVTETVDLQQLATGLAALAVPVLGGFERGLDREMLLRVAEAGGRITAMLPLGLDHAAPILALLRPALDAHCALVLSPFMPAQAYSERGGQARLALLSAMGAAMLQVEPDVALEAWPGAKELLARGDRVAVLSRSDSAEVRSWEAGGAQICDHGSGALAAVAAGWAQVEELGPEPDALPGVEPIVFHDADEAIDILGRSGRVPPSLARRLRESGMFGYQDVEDVDEPYEDPEPDA